MDTNDTSVWATDVPGIPASEVIVVGLVLLLLLLALVFGGVGLFVEGLKWLLIIALVLFIASAFSYRGRSNI